MSIVAKVTLSERLTKLIQNLDLKVNLTSDQLVNLHHYSVARMEYEEEFAEGGENSLYQVMHPPEAYEACFDRFTQTLYVLHRRDFIFKEYCIDDIKDHLDGTSNLAIRGSMNTTRLQFPKFYQWLIETDFPEVPSNP